MVNLWSILNHETLDSCTKFVEILTKFEQIKMRDYRQDELPTISRPYMKKAGVTGTPRRMPSSTPS
jgi:hypothetical protein